MSMIPRLAQKLLEPDPGDQQAPPAMSPITAQVDLRAGPAGFRANAAISP